MVYYHGTSTAQVDSILREGLIPSRGKGGDYWAHNSPQAALARVFVGEPTRRAPSVYLTRDRTWAERFGEFSANVAGGKSAILAVHLPKGDKLVHDEEFEQGYRFEGTIPPEYIKLVRGVAK